MPNKNLGRTAKFFVDNVLAVSRLFSQKGGDAYGKEEEERLRKEEEERLRKEEEERLLREE